MARQKEYPKNHSTLGYSSLDPPRLPAPWAGASRLDDDSAAFGWASAVAVGAMIEAVGSSSFAFAPGVAALSAKSAGTRKKANAIVARMRAPNFIVAS